jgi:hypothetical protein
LNLDELAAKNVHEFAFIMQPLKIQDGTGSTVAPISVRWSVTSPRRAGRERSQWDIAI